MNDGKILSEPNEIVESFSAKFKANFSRPDSSSIFAVNAPSACQPLSNAFFSDHFVLTHLRRVREGAASGPDGIPARILHKCAVAIAPFLASLFNVSLASGCIPLDWKNANIVPVFKSGVKEDVNNYRPVALTSVVCKLLEKMLSYSILEHFQTNGLIN